MAQGGAIDDGVVIAAAVFVDGEIAVGDEIMDDALDGAFGDDDLLGEVAHAQGGIAGEADQHVRVVGQKSPRGGDRLGRRCDW